MTYTWTVVPIQVEDRYKITIDTTFETVVPIPVVTVEPTVIDLAEITATETVVNVKVTNHGLIAAQNTRLSFPTHPLWQFTPAIDQIGALSAMSSITVPVVIRRLLPGSAMIAEAAVAQAAPPDLGPCHTSAHVDWELVCGGRTNTYASSIAIPNARSGCNAPPSPGGGGGGGNGSPSSPFISSSSITDDCPPECFDNGSLTGGDVTKEIIRAGNQVDPPAALGDLLKFRAFGVQDSGGQKLFPCRCSPLEPIAPVGVTYRSVTTTPSGVQIERSGPEALIIAEELGTYSCKFYAEAIRECPPKAILVGQQSVSVEVGLEVIRVDATNPQSTVVTYTTIPQSARFDVANFYVNNALKGVKPDAGGEFSFSFDQNELLIGSNLIRVDAFAGEKKTVKAFNADRSSETVSQNSAALGSIAVNNAGFLPVGFEHDIYVNRDLVSYDAPTVPTSKLAFVRRTHVNLKPIQAIYHQGIFSWTEGFRIEKGDVAEYQTTLSPEDQSSIPGQSPNFQTRKGEINAWFATDAPLAGIGRVESVFMRTSRGAAIVMFGLLSPREVSVSVAAGGAGSGESPAAPTSELVANSKQLTSAGRIIQNGILPSGEVCARVKVRLEQDAVITRDAFRATLEVDNRGASQLDNLRVDIAIRSQSGGTANHLFGIVFEGATGLTGIDGTGILPGNSKGTARWRIVPTVDAAPLIPTQFLVGGTLSYRLDGFEVAMPFYEVPITVFPSPNLTLQYFHQRDVFSDDPFTPQVEPTIPYSLAVMVINNGAGTALNMRITSAQPTIVDNEKDLLIDFQTIATTVAGQPLQPSLTASFGDIGPGEIKIGEWLFTSSLQGLFIDYKATVEHIDGLGNPKLSVIEDVQIHEMIHQVQALGALDDGKPDFLVNDIEDPLDPRDLPDTLYLSDGTSEPVTVVEAATVAGTLSPTQLTLGITATMPAGWTYLRIPEPSNGQYVLSRVIRSDGLELPMDVDAWVTDRTFIGQGQRPIYENILHLLDYDSTGQYTLVYQVKPAADTLAPTSHVRPLAGQSPLQFPVTWEGDDNFGVAYYDIYVSEDGAPATLWLQRTRDTGALYPGELGKTYAFHSRATDFAGNVEAAPAGPDASTAVTIQNAPPTLAAVADQDVNEGETLVVDLSGSDPDGRSDLLRYAFASAVPPGLTINSQTGQIRWVTGEADGGRVVPVDVSVIDTGVPALSATRSLVIRVTDTNTAPTLQDVPPQRVAVGGSLTVQLAGSDADLPAQTLAYRFTTTPPAGMTIGETTGLIAWQPAAADADRTVLISVAARDSGNPAKEAALSFPVTVDPAVVDRAPQFYATGGQIWLAGTTYTLPVNAFDPDGDAVKLTLNTAGLPGGVTFTSTDGTGVGSITWNTSGVAPGVYPLPLKAQAGLLQAGYSPSVKIVANNAYWQWAREALKDLNDFAKSDPTSNADGDDAANVFEWALLRNAREPDATPFSFRLQAYEGGWLAAELDLHRRRGSNQFVTLAPQYSDDLAPGSWSDVVTPDFEVLLDPFGDRDGNPESEEVLFRIWMSPDNPVAKKFFRIKAGTRPILP